MPKMRVIEKMNLLVGYNTLKEELKKIIWLAELNQTQNYSKIEIPYPEHWLIVGDLNTEKSIIAMLIGETYKACGMLLDGTPHCILGEELIGTYMGQTQCFVRQQVENAKGGVLFITELDTLINKGEIQDCYRHEAVNALLYSMEKYKGQVVVVIAGNIAEMEKFLELNPAISHHMSTIVLND